MYLQIDAVTPYQGGLPVNAALPVGEHALGHHIHALPVHVQVIRHAHVGEHRVGAAGDQGIGIALHGRAWRHTKEAKLRVDGIQAAVGSKAVM